MKFARNIFWTIVLAGLFFQVFAGVILHLEGRITAEEVAMFGYMSLLVATIFGCAATVVLSRLSWAYESPAARECAGSLGRKAAATRRILVHVVMPFLAAALMAAATPFVQAIIVIVINQRIFGNYQFSSPEDYLAFSGIIAGIVGFLLWSAGIRTGEDPY